VKLQNSAAVVKASQQVESRSPPRACLRNGSRNAFFRRRIVDLWRVPGVLFVEKLA
jgi:hypothetical protein